MMGHTVLSDLKNDIILCGLWRLNEFFEVKIIEIAFVSICIIGFVNIQNKPFIKVASFCVFGKPFLLKLKGL